MSSKLRSLKLSSALILSLSLVVLGCAKESEPADQPITIQFKTDRTQCLNEIADTFGEYVDGNLSAAKLSEFWECTRDSIQMFLDVTKGKRNNQSYSPYEIKRFLEEYFLEGYTLSPRLIDEVMQLKIVLVGGSLTEVSRDELTKLQGVLTRVEEATQVLRPHMRIISKGLISPAELQVSLAQVEAVEAGVRQAFQVVARVLSKEGRNYSLNRFESLLVEVLKAAGSKESDDNIKNIRQYFPLVPQAKKLLVEKEPLTLLAIENSVAPTQWARFFEVASDLVGYFLRFRLFVEQGDWKQGRGFEQIHHIVISAETLLRRAISERTNPYYEIKELTDFAKSFSRIGLLPEQFDEAAIETTINVVVNRLLVIGSEPYEADRFSIYHLDSLRSEYWRWYSSQKFIHSLEVSSQSLAPTGDPAVDEMRRVLDGPWALKQDQHGRLEFDFPAPSDSNLESRSLLNLGRALIRLLILGYAEDGKRKESLAGLKKDELLQLESDLHPLLEALGLVAEGESIGARLFIEANLFMPRGDGDELLGFLEGVEYFSFVLSGLQASGVIFDDLTAQCPTIEEDGEKKIAIDCFRVKISADRVRYLGHLPRLLDYLNSGTPELWSNVEINLERALRDSDLTQPISRGEALKMWVLLQYIETFFGRFDVDQNTTVNLPESMESYKIFRRTLEELLTGALADDFGVEAFFTFTMRYGETPFNAKWGGELKFLNWKWSKDQWNYEANRLRVLKILAALNELI